MSDQHQHHSGTGDNVGRDKIVHYHYPPPPEPPCQLPPLDACFLGRDKELDALLEQLQPGKVAAVCGPGGMGKSALAAQAVHKLEEGRFPDGIVFHSFYHQPSTDMALQTICAAYQVEAKVGLADTVRQVLADRKALLILDGAEEADDLKAVLPLRSTCGVLITSRKRADAQGFRLDLKPLEEQPATAVFCEHSGLAEDDESVQDICKILDGWPVGLRIAGRYCNNTGESAADYLRWLEQEPFKELGDGEHQEENAALLLRRSVAQVSDDARLALGVAGSLAFAPIARDPVVAVLDEDKCRTRNALGQLVNYGLLETSGERWQISHALVHTYARIELALSKEELEQLAEYYINFSWIQSEIGLSDREIAHCLRLMDNCLEHNLWRITETLNRTLGVHERLMKSVGVRRCEKGFTFYDCSDTFYSQLIAAARQADDRWSEGWYLDRLGYTYAKHDDYTNALMCYEKSLLAWQILGSKKEECMTLNSMADIYRQQGEVELALQTYQQNLSISQEIGDRKGEGTVLNNIGRVYYTEGDYEQALQYYEQCLSIRRETKDKIGEGITLNNIAVIYDEKGNPAKAIEYYEQDLAIQQAYSHRKGEVFSRWNLGLTYIDIGDIAKAEEHISLAAQIAEKIGLPDLEEWHEELARVQAMRQGTKEA